MKEFLPQNVPKQEHGQYSIIKIIFADTIGLLTLLGIIALCASITPANKVTIDDWVGIFLLLAVPMAGMWHVDKPTLTKTSDCVKTAGSSILVGACFFAVDIAVGHWDHPKLSLLAAAWENPGPGGVVLTLITCPGVLFIAISSLARSLFPRL